MKISARGHKNQLLISAIIVNYNGKHYVKKCVDSLLASNTRNLEIIVVDNGSSDGSISALEKYREKVNLLKLNENYGPAYARNQGVKVAKGRYIGFLDNDTLVDKDWARTAVKAFEKDEKLGIIQCKLLLNKERNRLDYVGEYLGQNGFLVQKAHAGEIDTKQYDKPVRILAAKSAGMFIRHNVFKKIGGFDEDYFIYVEETDLGWRCWLAGYECRYLPTSIVYHEFGTSTVILGKSKNNYNAKFHGCKNYILTLFKNLSFINLIKILPVHILLWEGLSIYALLKGSFKNFFWINKGIIWNLVNIRDSIKKRSKIQRNRKITDNELHAIVMIKKPFLYFLYKATNKHRVGN